MAAAAVGPPQWAALVVRQGLMGRAALAAKAGAAKAAMGHLETRRAELLTRAGAAGAKAQKQLGLAVRVGAAL